MSRRLVVCCDGTWNTPDQGSSGRATPTNVTGNTPDQGDEGQATPTNVTRFALGVADTGDDGREQRVFYDRGVGTSRWQHILGGAFGLGLSRNVKDAYRFLVQNYRPGDEVFLFGFSRGAFTARSTAGFIRNAGILRPEHADRVDEAYRLYRDKDTKPRTIESQLFRRSFSHEVRIRFIGVWDTVGALGLPASGVPGLAAINKRWSFHDTKLSTSVDAAFHALAIDEQRRPFAPTLWQQQPDAVGQRLEQVWFAGVHCDVGGGYRETGLSDIALLWMVARARSYGLAFRPGAFAPGVPGTVPGPGPGDDGLAPVVPDPMGKEHNSRKGFYRLQRRLHRPIGAPIGDPTGDPTGHLGHQSVANTAVARKDSLPGYAPPQLLRYLKDTPTVTDVLRQA